MPTVKKRVLRGVALACIAAQLAACSTHIAPLGAYKVGSSPFTVADLQAQDAAEQSCWAFADETNPSEWELATRFGGPGGGAGFVGGAGNYLINAAIVGFRAVAENVLGAATGYSFIVAVVNGVNGAIYQTILVWKDAGQCKKEEALGIRHFKPSDLERLRKGEITEILVQGPTPPISEAARRAVTGSAVTAPPP